MAQHAISRNLHRYLRVRSKRNYVMATLPETSDALFIVGGYGIKASDIISFAALLVALGALRLSWRSDRRARAKDKHDREKEAKRSDLRVELLSATYDLERPNPTRQIDMYLRSAEDGISDEVVRCTILKPKCHRVALTAGGQTYEGERSTETPYFIVNASNGSHVGVELTFLGPPKGETHIRFDIVRRDNIRSKKTLNVTVPPGTRAE
jgi:hypothetical protein